MAKKTYRFNARIALHDPSKDREASYSPNGALLLAGVCGRKWVEAGTPVSLDEAQGDAILKTAGLYIEPTTEDKTFRL